MCHSHKVPTWNSASRPSILRLLLRSFRLSLSSATELCAQPSISSLIFNTSSHSIKLRLSRSTLSSILSDSCGIGRHIRPDFSVFSASKHGRINMQVRRVEVTPSVRGYTCIKLQRACLQAFCTSSMMLNLWSQQLHPQEQTEILPIRLKKTDQESSTSVSLRVYHLESLSSANHSLICK